MAAWASLDDLLDALAGAPFGTKAPSILGGWWFKMHEAGRHGGWKWLGPDGNGGTWPKPGGDWNGRLIPPQQAKEHTP